MLASKLDIDRLTRGLPRTAQTRQRRSVPLPAVAAGAAFGGALAVFLLDPREGRRRRTEAAARAAGISRRLLRGAARQTRYVQGVLDGTVERVQRSGLRTGTVDDATLTAKVMSEVFGDPDVPKGAIDLNAEHGIVVLRGEVRTPELMASIEQRVRDVDGVRDVRNLLHLPKTPAKMDKGPHRS